MSVTSTSSLSGIGSFVNLKSIHMSGSQFGSVILPQELFALSHLQFLFMAQCQLEGPFPEQVGNLVNLIEFDFYGNALTGTLPTTLGQLTNLLAITLSLNKLSGSLPSQLG